MPSRSLHQSCSSYSRYIFHWLGGTIKKDERFRTRRRCESPFTDYVIALCTDYATVSCTVLCWGSSSSGKSLCASCSAVHLLAARIQREMSAIAKHSYRSKAMDICSVLTTPCRFVEAGAGTTSSTWRTLSNIQGINRKMLRSR